MSICVLIVEDEINLGNSIKKGLQEVGFNVDYAPSATMALTLINENSYHIIISDILMPELNGVEFLKQIRSKGIDTPFLFLSALGSMNDKILGFDLGADDYLVKPFEFRELVARIKAISKRLPQNKPELLYCSDLKVDVTNKSVIRDNVNIQLTPREFDLLVYFLENQDRLISKKELAEKVWGHNFDTGTNVIEVYINYLRSKINLQNKKNLIENVHGQGYRLNN